MSQIGMLSLDALEHDELYEVLHDINKQLTCLFDSVPEDAKNYMEAVEELDKAWSEDKDNAMIAADTAADMAWKDFDAFLNGIINYPVVKISDAATEVKYVFDQFGDPTDLPYEQEYDVLKNLIAALEEIPAIIRQNAMVDPLIEQLKQRHAEFIKLFQMYEKTDELQNFVAIREAKAKVSKEYRDLIDNFNTSLRKKESDDLDAFANQVNDIISKPLSRANVKARTRRLG